MGSPQELLAELDRLLEETSWKGPPSDLTHLTANPEHLQLFQQQVLGGGHQESMARCLAGQLGKALETEGTEGPLRLCSVGCGDGKLDRKTLAELLASHPGLAVEYVGVGLCEQSCEEVEGEVGGVGERVKVRAVARDYSELSREEVGSFHCVLMVSCLCYSVVPEATLQAVLGLLEPGGRLVIVSSSRQSVDQLISRFWKHQRHYDLCTTEDATAILKKMGREFSILQHPVTFDLSSCLQDQFRSPQSKLVLDHLMQVNMDEYGPAIREMVIEYLRSTVGTCAKLESLCDVIIIDY